MLKTQEGPAKPDFGIQFELQRALEETPFASVRCFANAKRIVSMDKVIRRPG
jgi:hypothetical protein